MKAVNNLKEKIHVFESANRKGDWYAFHYATPEFYRIHQALTSLSLSRDPIRNRYVAVSKEGKPGFSVKCPDIENLKKGDYIRVVYSDNNEQVISLIEKVSEPEFTVETLEYLKKKFTELWPDANQAIKNPRNRQHFHALCQWEGFKKGYYFGNRENFRA